MLGLTTPFCFSSSAVQGEKTYLPYTPGFHIFSTDARQLLISSIKNGNNLLTFYPVLLHLLDFCNRFSQIISELFAVLRIGCIEVDEDFDISSRNG